MPSGQFVAKVRLLSATYEKDGLTHLVPEWLEWGEVPYVEPNECCCRESHNLEECAADVCCGTMCRKCANSWAQDHDVILPNLI